CAYAAAIPEVTAIPMSSKVGDNLASISKVTIFKGISKVTPAANARDIKVPEVIVTKPFFSIETSYLTIPIEKDTIGEIMGARIIAPIITGEELAKSPKVAIRVDSTIITIKGVDNLEFTLSTLNRSSNCSAFALG